MKQITITVPDNCELKQDGNTYTIVEKEKKHTYKDVAEELFGTKTGGKVFWVTEKGNIASSPYGVVHTEEPVNCVSIKQAEKLLAINKLMNVAKYLNGDWQPDWNNVQKGKYYIYLDNTINSFYIDYSIEFQGSYVYFKSEELAKKAIEILGEETIKLALCTDY